MASSCKKTSPSADWTSVRETTSNHRSSERTLFRPLTKNPQIEKKVGRSSESTEQKQLRKQPQ